jgi:glutathione synthase/RimK-type ligase-like ATP-grasp enzyme
MEFDVALLTQREYVAPENPDAYVSNVLHEDRLLSEALQMHGLHVKRVAWDDAGFDWTTTRTALFRATWDYFHRFDEFKNWLKSVEKKTKLINSPGLVWWNIDKHYLKDLQHKGVHVPATVFMEPGDVRTLAELHSETGWGKTVLKPAVSGGGRHTYLLEGHDLNNYEPVYKSLISKEAMLLQNFQENVVSKGEITLVVIGGKYTHAVLKKAKQGDFRVQDDFGGTVHPYNPSTEEIEFAELVISKCPERPVYGRVDLIWDNEGKLAVSELELIEPELWFRTCPDAAEQLAGEVVRLFKE